MLAFGAVAKSADTLILGMLLGACACPCVRERSAGSLADVCSALVEVAPPFSKLSAPSPRPLVRGGSCGRPTAAPTPVLQSENFQPQLHTAVWWVSLTWRREKKKLGIKKHAF